MSPIILLSICILTHLILPFVCLAWLLWERGKNRLYKIMTILTTTTFLLLMKLAGAGWYWLGLWWPNLFVILLVPACFFSIKKIKRLPWLPQRKFLPWFNVSILFILTVTFFMALVSYTTSRKYKEQALQLRFPLQNGIYYIAHGGNQIGVNHHYPIIAQRYALDIVKINRWGLRANGLIPSDLNAYKIFKDKLFAPCSGQIIAVENQFHDNIPFQMDPKNLAGNHIILYCKDHSVLLAHLKKGSIPVSVGDYVEEGDFIGEVGNTGNTTEPHLHIHAVKGKIVDSVATEAIGVPMTFNGKFLIRGDRLIVP